MTSLFFTTNASSLGGGGYQGIQPVFALDTISSSSRSTNRLTLRRAFGDGSYFKDLSTKPSYGITPFRFATNSGDPNSTTNQAPTGILPQINQVGSTGNSLVLSQSSYGGPVNNGNAYYTGNPKHVYDSSNYTTYRKQQTINRNYNDSSFGGDQYSASQTALAAIRK